MGTPHINAKKDDFAKTVLMPGDPRRATFIAENFLSDVRLVNDVRGILAYTGTYKGKKVSVMASGMGQPSIGIYSHELYAHYGVETIIRVGTCGSYQEKVKLFDVIIATGASTNSSWSRQYNLQGGTYSAVCDFLLARKVYDIAKETKTEVVAGNVFSSDIFYDENPDIWKEWAKLGVLGVEMESYALYTIAARLDKKALCLLTVTDHFITHEKATSEQRELGLRKMIVLALEAATR